MKTVLIDGAPIEFADDLSATVVATAINKLKDAAVAANDRVSSLDAKVSELSDTAQKQVGEIAVLKKQLADSAVTPEKLDVLVKARTAVIDAASTVLEQTFAYGGKSIEDIRRAAVTVKLGDAAKDMSDAAIEGAFTLLTLDAKPASGVRTLGDALGGRPAPRNVGDAAAVALAERDKALSDAWRSKQ